LGFDPIDTNMKKRGGVFLDRPQRGRNCLDYSSCGMIELLPLSIQSFFAAWSYLIVDGFIKTITYDLWKISLWGRILIPIIVFVLFLSELHRFDEPTDVPEALPPETRKDVFME
jgi:hypothetical protein